MSAAQYPHWVEHPTVPGLYTIDRGDTIDVVLEVGTSRFEAVMETVDESLRRMAGVQALARRAGVSRS